MPCIVQKFGGTSVADIERIRYVAKRVAKTYHAGHQVAVVVSAMAGVTDQLVDFTRALSLLSSSAEHDVVLASGEQVTCGLLSMALNHLNIPSRSYLAWQIEIQTSSEFGQASILHIQKDQLIHDMNQGIIPVISGFQGIDGNKRLTTLGRGGSDTTAVSLAAALGAKRCEIYTDVAGVYSADPKMVPHARKLSFITFDEMFELASQGAKVLQTRSIEMAIKHKVALRVLSSFDDCPGTDIVCERQATEDPIIVGITHNLSELKITLFGIPNDTFMIADVFTSLASENIHVDMIVKNISLDDQSDLTFTIPKLDSLKAQEVIAELRARYAFRDVHMDLDIAKISVVGVGIQRRPGVAGVIFKTLASKGIAVQVISTSGMKMSILVPREYLEVAILALHSAYGLDNKKGN